MTQDQPRLISVLRDSHACLGFISICGGRGYKSYGSDGQLLGYYDSKESAVEAVCEAAIVSSGDGT
jgi:hypothetical protein